MAGRCNVSGATGFQARGLLLFRVIVRGTLSALLVSPERSFARASLIQRRLHIALNFQGFIACFLNRSFERPIEYQAERAVFTVLHHKHDGMRKVGIAQ